MMQEIFFRTIFSMGSLFFLILLLFAYVSKKFELKLRNKIYVYFAVICLSVILTELVTYYYFALGSSQFIYTIYTKLQCLAVISWGWILMCYCYALIHKSEESSFIKYLFGHKMLKFHLVYCLIAFAICMVIPAPDITDKVINFLPNYAFPCIIHYMGTAVMIFVMSCIHFKTLNKKERIILAVLVFEVPTFAFLQSFLPGVAFLSLCNCIQTYLIYFYFENPDLFMIEEITKLTEETEKLSRVKSEFLSNMSHEIRSPINAIVGFSEVLMNDPEFNKERTVNDIKIIESSSKNLLEIINNILDISKIESNQDTLVEKNYSLSKIIEDLDAIVKTRIADKNIKLIINQEEGIPDKLYGDSTKIFQILLNILTNAAKYTEVGKIVVDIHKKINGDKIILSFKVSDTGYGIKKEDFDKMFEKFSRLDTATTNEIEGTGLGLVITKRYVTLMQGKIWFESEYGVGTTFYVDVPQTICKDQNIQIEDDYSAKISNNIPTNLSNFNILLVDDNKLNIKVAERLLSKYNFNITSVISGKDCIYKIKEDNHYDLIFMDIMMPDMDGVETLHTLKKLSDIFAIPPVVALTADAISGAKEMYLAEGFDDYLSKPIDRAELERVIEKFITSTIPVVIESVPPVETSKPEETNNLNTTEKVDE